MDLVLMRDISLQFLRAEMLRRAKRGRRHVRPSTILGYAEIIKMPENELQTFFETLLIKEDVDGANVLSRSVHEIALDIMIVQANPGNRKLIDDDNFASQTAAELQITVAELKMYVDYLGKQRQERFGLA